MKRNTKRTTKRKSKTVISLRCRTPRPHLLEFYFRPASRIAVLVLCFSEILGVGAPAAGAGNFSSAGNKHQEPYAVIFGTVWGPDDRPLYGVKIKIRRQHEKKARWELYSDHSGEFAQRVPAGKQDYVVWADAKSYKAQNGRPLQGDEVEVHVDDDERVDTGLHLK
jgi:hypothetical protein